MFCLAAISAAHLRSTTPSPSLLPFLRSNGTFLKAEFNYEYRGDAEELAFAKSFPVISFCFLNSSEVDISGKGISVSNSGGSIKGLDWITSVRADDLDEFLRAEEMAAARAYLERYPKHKPAVFGEAHEATVEGETTSPEPPLFAFSRAFPALALALTAEDSRVVLCLGRKAACVLYRQGREDIVIAAPNDKKTIRGFLATLDGKLSA
jgi:hypothetical protein